MLCSLAQGADNGMQVRQHNFTGFTEDKIHITATVLQHTPPEFRKHPEFGVLPYKAGCHDCVELLHKRDFFTRYFIDPNNIQHFYIQKSYFPLHYRDASGWLRTIDPRLKPVSGKPNLFAALNQPFPAYYDQSRNEVTLESGPLRLAFNSRLALYFLDKNGHIHLPSGVDFTHSSVGESGVLTKEAWENIDIQQIFEAGQVKTNYIIKEPLQGWAGLQWMVFEDIITLPPAMTLHKTNGRSYEEDLWMGDLEIHSENTSFAFRFSRPVCYDKQGVGLYGFYRIQQNGNDYRLMTLIPVDWLASPHTSYPVTIDPVVLAGRDSLGKFLHYYLPDTVFAGADMAFTRSPQSCDYTLIVNVPGKTELFDVYIDVEYKNSDTITCATVTPGHPQPFCIFTDVSMEVVGPCGSTGQLRCDTTNVSPYLGTCTTDPRKVPGAGALRFANFAACVKPQCPDYLLPFTLKNRTFQCPESCAYNCAIGSFFAVTVEGRTIENVVHAEVNGRVLTIWDTVCAGTPVHLVSVPDYGVPPYPHYLWTPSGLTDSVATVYPETTTMYVGTAYDTCDNSAADTVWVNVIPAPPADAGRDTVVCDGSPMIILGGSPTGPPGTAYRWTANPPAALGYLSSATAPNPQVLFPQGAIGSYTFTVEVQGTRCSRFDSVTVVVNPLPAPVLQADTNRICAGESILLSVIGDFRSYQWSNGSTAPTIRIYDDGVYSVTVTDSAGCAGASVNAFQATIIAPPAFTVFPADTSVESGSSVTLGTDIDLSGPSVDSFYWIPDLDISCTDCPAPVVTPSSNQEYTLVVRSPEGCAASESVFIRVILPDAYAIPSAFSPNQDGMNDAFFILKASGVTVKEFKIFNRWGQIVHDAVTPWNGIFKDEPQPVGVYTYLFILQLFNGQIVREAGNVTLIR